MENNFVLHDENSEWSKFCDATYKATHTESDQPLLTKLEKLMPHFKDKNVDFWTWVKNLSSGNEDQVCCFWSQMSFYLHAYVGFLFAIHSGNWLLRNS